MVWHCSALKYNVCLVLTSANCSNYTIVVHYNSHYIVLSCAHPGGTLNISAAHKCIWCAVVYLLQRIFWPRDAYFIFDIFLNLNCLGANFFQSILLCTSTRIDKIKIFFFIDLDSFSPISATTAASTNIVSGTPDTPTPALTHGLYTPHLSSTQMMMIGSQCQSKQFCCRFFVYKLETLKKF